MYLVISGTSIQLILVPGYIDNQYDTTKFFLDFNLMQIFYHFIYINNLVRRVPKFIYCLAYCVDVTVTEGSRSNGLLNRAKYLYR